VITRTRVFSGMGASLYLYEEAKHNPTSDKDVWDQKRLDAKEGI